MSIVYFRSIDRCASRLRLLAVAAGGLLLAATGGVWANGGERVDFADEVYPLLRRHCFECHDGRRSEAGLRLDAVEQLAETWVIEPHQPEQSELLRRVMLDADDPERMPSVGDPLGKVEVATLRRWIEQGAQWPEEFEPPAHWAYQPPQRVAVADLEADIAATASDPIDVWVREKLRGRGLTAAPSAAPERLIRRVHLDLIGLPPTPEEVTAFVADPSEAAYQRIVDDLLARPQFGERWARSWLDLARYADSHGFQRDDFHQLWAYRDWVIAALSDDMPFDQFTIEQLAGDLLPEATESQRIATGFHRCSPTNVEAGSLPEETRTSQLVDRVNTTATVWLGTTLECAQCHDHKYDPFAIEEYYGLLAFFNATEIEADLTNPNKPSSIAFRGPTMRLDDPEKDAARRRVRQQLDQVEAALKQRRRELREQLVTESLEAQQDEEDDERGEPLQGEALTKAVNDRVQDDPQGAERRSQVDDLKEQLKSLQPDSTLVMVQREPRSTYVFQRGDYRDPGDEVTPHTPAALHSLDPRGAHRGAEPDADHSLPDRLSLARWLVDPANPLVGRVTVNRLWLELFGRGLVDTPEDFGVKGSPPTHPRVLDDLAADFVQGGWSMKRVLRRIVTSATYRQSSLATTEQMDQDPENRWLARGPRFRLDAETIRDNALAISGLLDLQMFGPPIRPYQPPGLWVKVGGQRYDYQVSEAGGAYRRGVYIVLKRGSPYPSLINFDATNRLACTVQRGRTATPLQALTLLNDPVYVEMAQAMAARAVGGKASPGSVIDDWFRRATARSPSDEELQVLLDLHRQQREAAQQGGESAVKLAGDFGPYDEAAAADFTAWYSVATTLLNLHETVTKP